MEFLFNLFLFCLILIKISPFYFLPVQSSFFVSHTLAKLLIFFIFILVNLIDRKELRRIFAKQITVIKLVVVYFISQSVSVVSANDILLFLKSYQNVISGILIFLLSFIFIKNQVKRIDKLNRVIVFLASFLILLEFFFIFFNSFFVDLLKNIIQNEVVSAYVTDFTRGRSSLGLNLEIFLPFFVVFLFQEGTGLKKRALSALSLIGISFLSLLSNFRTRIVSLIFSAFLSLIFFIKYSRKIFHWKRLIPVGLIIVSAIFISNRLFSFNIYDRLFLKDAREDVTTIKFRVDSAFRSINLWSSSPLIGIGLGNYIFSDNNTAKFDFSYSQEDKYAATYSGLVGNSPHNVFFHTLSETGIFGLVSYLLLLFYFMKGDWKIFIRLKENKLTDFNKACIISSWTIFLFMLFNPSHTIFVSGWFWAVRGFREATI